MSSETAKRYTIINNGCFSCSAGNSVAFTRISRRRHQVRRRRALVAFVNRLRIGTRLGPGFFSCGGFSSRVFSLSLALSRLYLSPSSLIRVLVPHFFALPPLCRRFAHSRPRQRVTDARGQKSARRQTCLSGNPFDQPWQPPVSKCAALHFSIR